MNAEIIIVGSDILIGDRVDSVAQYISKHLSMCKIKLNWKTTVAGEYSNLNKALTVASYRSDFVVIIGGIGPFDEDITTEAFCKSFNLRLVTDKKSISKINKHYEALKKEVPEPVLKRAFVPKGAEVFQNEIGLAPGYFTVIGKTKFAILPANFEEAKGMFDSFILPAIIEATNVVSVCKILNVVSLSRVTINEKIGGLFHSNNPNVALIENNNEYIIKIVGCSDNFALANELCENCVEKIKKRLGENVYGENYNNIAEKTVELLKQRRKKIAIAESCTGGLVSAKLVSVSGASEVLDFSACTYSNKMKSLALDVKKNTLEAYGAVSSQTAIEMAIGIKKISGADIAVSVTGVAGPACSENKPVGLVYFGLYDGKKAWSFKYKISSANSNRNIVRNISTVAALDIARRYLIKSPAIYPYGKAITEEIYSLDYIDCVKKSLTIIENRNKKLADAENVFTDEQLSDYINEIFNSEV